MGQSRALSEESEGNHHEFPLAHHGEGVGCGTSNVAPSGSDMV